ncbi:MAG: hypothetical protein KJ048_00255 [Dehalococcoidia bacterium]|nr:hypothetical protein [Dehalococcoidia bacterium]
MNTRWLRLTLAGLAVAVVGLASALAIVLATDDDGDSSRGNPQTTNGTGWYGMMDPEWMMGADGMHSYMHAALSDDDYSAMVRYMQWAGAGSQGADPVDDATAHRIWDNMMGSGWMMTGPGMMMSEDQMRSYMGGILSGQDFALMYDHMQWRWSGSNGADPLDDATAHRIWDEMMVGMNTGQWSMWDDRGTCWD